MHILERLELVINLEIFICMIIAFVWPFMDVIIKIFRYHAQSSYATLLGDFPTLSGCI